MKKMLVVLVAALAMGGVLTAQGNGKNAQAAAAAKTVTVEGKLALVDGFVAIVQSGKTYYLELPSYLFGFIDGLKEGATVKITGNEIAVRFGGAAGSSHLVVTSLTIGTRTIDLTQAAMQGGRGEGFGGPGMMGQGGGNR